MSESQPRGKEKKTGVWGFANGRLIEIVIVNKWSNRESRSPLTKIMNPTRHEHDPSWWGGGLLVARVN